MVLFSLSTFCTLNDVLSQNFKWKKKKICNIFSLAENFKEFIQINESENVISCVNSLKVLSAFWIVLGHRKGQSMLDVVGSSFLSKKVYMFYIGFRKGVTIFFVCSGILVTRSLLKTFER